MSRQEIVASSKTYRKVNSELSDALGIDAVHTRKPSEDFARIVEQITSQPAIDEGELTRIAEEYYRLGVRRGLRAATDRMVEGHFFMKGAECFVEGNTAFNIRVRMPDGKREQLSFNFTAEDLGFGV